MKLKKFFTYIRYKVTLIAIDVSFAYVFIGIFAYYTVNKITDYTELNKPLNRIYTNTLMMSGALNDFLSEDVRDTVFFSSGESIHTQQFNNAYEDTQQQLISIKDQGYFNLLGHENKKLLQQTEKNLQVYNKNFNDLKLLYKKRGNTTYGLIGALNNISHRFEAEIAHLPNHQLHLSFARKREMEVRYNYTLNANLEAKIDSQRIRINNIIQTDSSSHAISDTMAYVQKNALLNLLKIENEKSQELYKINEEINSPTNGVLVEISDLEKLIETKVQELNLSIGKTIESEVTKAQIWLFVIIALFALITLLMVSFIRNSITTPLGKIQTYIKQLAQGLVPEKLILNNDDEITKMLKSINKLVDGIRAKVTFANEIEKGNLEAELNILSKDDTLSLSLIDMQQSLVQARQEENKRKEEENEQKWISSGVAKFADILRKNNDDLNQLGEDIITELVHYINANQGGIFIYNNDNPEKPFMELIASYAFNRKKFIRKEVEIGVGLIGNMALEKKKVHLHKLPPEYLEITSGLGEAEPTDLLIVPLIFNEIFYGAVEVASFEHLPEYKIHFVEQISNNIASTLASVRVNLQTVKLLEQSKTQAEELASQEEEMRQNMEELQATQEEAARRERELQNLVTSIEHANYVIEYDAMGTILKVNTVAQEIIGLPENKLINRNVRDFTDIDEAEIDQMWKKLLAGEVIRRISKVEINKKTIWLSETYSPIIGNNDKVERILKFAIDITEEKRAEERLKIELDSLSKEKSLIEERLLEVYKKEKKLKEKDANLRELNDTMNKVFYIAILSPEKTIIEANEKLLALLSYDSHELIGKEHAIMLADPKQEEEIWEQVVSNQNYKAKFFVKTKAGQNLFLYLSYTPLLNVDGELKKVVIFAHDTLQAAPK